MNSNDSGDSSHRRLSLSDVRHNVRVNAQHGAWQSLAQSLYGPFLGVLAIKLGASNLDVALMSALPAAVASVASMLGSVVLRPFPRKKAVACSLIAATRLFLLGIAAIPAVVRSDAQATALVVLVALMNVPGAIGNISWQALLADSIPYDLRGDAMAERSRLVTAVAFIPTILGGYVLDAVRFPLGYQLALVVAFVLAMVEVRTLAQMREPDPELETRVDQSEFHPSRQARSEESYTPSAARGRSREFSLCAMLFYFGWMMGQPLFTIYYVRVLGVGNLWIGIFSIVSAVVQYSAFPMWSRFAARHGNTMALAIATMGMALTPLMIGVSPWPWLIAVFSASMGFFTSGTTLLMLNTLLEMAPSENRTSHIAFHNGVVNFTAFVGPLMGKVVVDATNIYWALGICSICRGIGSGALYVFARSLRQRQGRVHA